MGGRDGLVTGGRMAPAPGVPCSGGREEGRGASCPPPPRAGLSDGGSLADSFSVDLRCPNLPSSRWRECSAQTEATAVERRRGRGGVRGQRVNGEVRSGKVKWQTAWVGSNGEGVVRSNMGQCLSSRAT